jgi:MoaA/NifB/PqqE/SkfB family radical SAM enzyme
MECKFIKHGIAIAYDQIVKPCCEWKITESWQEENQIQKTNIATWHQSPNILDQQQQLKNGIWPNSCTRCEKIELQGRVDSIRGNGNHAYSHYTDDDITLEIRPGSTCNFACQTCWPEASSRVAQYHSQAGLIDIKNLNSKRIDNFDFLSPIAHRIKDVVLLGGEPFYDKACLNFLNWAKEHLHANIMMFTNGSMIDFDFLTNYANKLTVIFSLDAIGKSAEYIRYGTDWPRVLENYKKVKSLSNVEVRVNITCSVYNYIHIAELIEFLCQDWPSVVSFGTPSKDVLKESVIPITLRPRIIDNLIQAVNRVKITNIEQGQKSNAINAIESIINNLKNIEYNPGNHNSFCLFLSKMDQVKNIDVKDYCNFLQELTQQEIA